jgi:protein involved in polysaccharide export with SLBB domain
MYGPGGAAETQMLVINLNDMIRRGDMSHNVQLRPDDVVFVPANPLAKVGLTLQQLLFPIRPALETVRTPAAAGGAVGGAN